MNRQQQKGRSFERLEHRSMMAGNVTAAVVGGNLTITGDGTANMLTLSEIGSTGKWQITGYKTSINGSAPKMVTGPITGDMTIDLGAGNDKLTIQDGSIPGHLFIQMGDGGDRTTLSNLTIGTYLHFEGNSGNDTLNVHNVQVTDPTYAFFSSIDMQDGNDKATIRNFSDQDLQLTMGAGNDQLSMTNCAFLGGPFQRLSVDTGDGNDTAMLKHDSTGPLSLNVGLGKNSVNVSKCTADAASFLNFGSGGITGSGNDFGTESVAPGFTKLGGEFNI